MPSALNEGIRRRIGSCVPATSSQCNCFALLLSMLSHLQVTARLPALLPEAWPVGADGSHVLRCCDSHDLPRSIPRLSATIPHIGVRPAAHLKFRLFLTFLGPKVLSELAGGVGGALLLCLVLCFCLRRRTLRKRREERARQDAELAMLPSIHSHSHEPSFDTESEDDLLEVVSSLVRNLLGCFWHSNNYMLEEVWQA